MTISRTRIGIVDDDDGMRTALGELLRSMGYETVGFESAAHFLASPQLSEFDCLIVDVHMPRMTGPALLEALVHAAVDIPALLMTAHDDTATLELIRRVEPIVVLRKPFRDDELSDAIRRTIGGGQ